MVWDLVNACAAISIINNLQCTQRKTLRMWSFVILYKDITQQPSRDTRSAVSVSLSIICYGVQT